MKFPLRVWSISLGIALLPLFRSAAETNVADDVNAIVARASAQTVKLLDQFSNLECTEVVEQEKLRSDGRVDVKEQSTYDYVVVITESGGELSLNESRVAVREAKLEKKTTPMLLSNGFATLFLVFHPHYVNSFQFEIVGREAIDGRDLLKLSFQHIPGTQSPAALALRGREYPLELSGQALVDVSTGHIAKIEGSVGDTLQDVGLKSIRSEVDFAPAPFRNLAEPFWLPSVARVEVETPRQHWRNTHRFTNYKRFSVSTEESIATK